MPNIDRFDEYVAVVLGRLYEQFPVKMNLDVRDITGHTDTNEFGLVCAPDGRESREAVIAYATIEWLVDTGYVRAASSAMPMGFQGCVLTAEGFEAAQGRAGQRPDHRDRRRPSSPAW